MPETWAPGAIVGDRYRLVALLGTGGMGQVWQAEHLALRSPVALKLMNHPKGAGGEERARVTTQLLREARAAASLASPHVVRILDYGVHEDRVPYVAMELLEGETLSDRLERSGGPLSIDDTYRVIQHVGRGVAKAHEQGLVHRDLKPDNIFLVTPEDDEQEEVAKVLDFGIAKLSARLADGVTAATKVGTLLGTPNYMSPEQAESEAEVDHRSDLWSLALVAFECMTGQMAFHAPLLGELLVKIVAGPMPIPSRVHPGSPPAFDDWFLSTAMRDPAARPESARELVRTLKLALFGSSASSGAWRLSGPPPSRASVGPASAARPRGAFGGMMSLGMGKGGKASGD